MARDPRYIKLIHSKEWRKLRAAKMAAQPLCEMCSRSGRLVFAEQVHHIKPVESARTTEGMRALMFDNTNLMALCVRCHTEIHKQLGSHNPANQKDHNEQLIKAALDRIGKD